MLLAARRSSCKQLFNQITRLLPEISPCAEPNQRDFTSAITSSQSFWHDEKRPDESLSFSPLSRGFSASAAARDDREEFSTDILSDSFESSVPEAPGNLLDADAISYAVSAAEAASLAAAWDDAWILNKAVQYCIHWIHDSTGLAWWQSISLATVVSRIATVPISLKQLKNTQNMIKARPELLQLQEWYKQQEAAGTGEKAKQEYMSRMAKVWEKHNCHPLKSMLPLVAQAPVFMGFFAALRSFAAAKVPSMTAGGLPFLWYSDLTVPDPYYTLPMLSTAVLLLTVELNAADGMQGQDPKTLSRTKNLMRGVCALTVLFTASMPQGIFYYWITSSVFALGQSKLFRVAGIRRVLKLPPLEPGESDTGLPPAAAAAAVGKPVKTFSAPPRKDRKQNRR